MLRNGFNDGRCGAGAVAGFDFYDLLIDVMSKLFFLLGRHGLRGERGGGYSQKGRNPGPEIYAHEAFLHVTNSPELWIWQLRCKYWQDPSPNWRYACWRFPY